MSAKITTIKLSDVDEAFAKLAVTLAGRTPITNESEIQKRLSAFGRLAVDAHMKREVFRFDSLGQFNAARSALCGTDQNAFPPMCSTASELIAFVDGGLLKWLAFGIPVSDGRRHHFVNLMCDDDIVGLDKDAA